MINLNGWEFMDLEKDYPKRYWDLLITSGFEVYAGYLGVSLLKIQITTERITEESFLDMPSQLLWKRIFIPGVLYHSNLWWEEIEKHINKEKSIGELIITELMSRNLVEI